MAEREEIADQLDDEIPNYEWMVNAVSTAMTTDRLDMLGHDIKIDSEAGVDYTTVPAQLDTIRALWKDRYTLILKKGTHVK